MRPRETNNKTQIVGPGSYDPHKSSFGGKKQGTLIGSPRDSVSPRLRAAAVNPGLLKIAAPSIPSKFLTPIIDTARTDLDSHKLINNEFC